MAVLLIPLQAQARDYFVTENSSTRLEDGVYLLSADLSLDISDDLRDALRNGVTLTVDIAVTVEEHRSWWLNKDIASLNQRYALTYHALSNQYVVRNTNTDLYQFYTTVGAALDAISQVRDLPLIDGSLLNSDDDYVYELIIDLDISELPLPLRARALFTQNWAPISEATTWPLR